MLEIYRARLALFVVARIDLPLNYVCTIAATLPNQLEILDSSNLDPQVRLAPIITSLQTAYRPPQRPMPPRSDSPPLTGLLGFHQCFMAHSYRRYLAY